MRNFLYNFFTSFKNAIYWFKIGWKDRYWDYHYINRIVYFKLKQLCKNWCVNIDYVGCEFTKKRIIVLLKKMENLLNEKYQIEKEEEFFKELKDFYILLGHNIHRFWD